MFPTLQEYTPQKPFLICVDVECCTRDTAAQRRLQCLGPCMVEEWELQPWSNKLLARWEELCAGGTIHAEQRFQALAVLLTEVDQELTRIEDVGSLAQWVRQSQELSERTVAAAAGRTGSPMLRKALHWVNRVNERAAQLSQQERTLLPNVLYAFLTAHLFAEMILLSGDENHAAFQGWESSGLLPYVDLILPRENGSKSRCLANLLQKGIAPEHVLLVGNTPADRRTAHCQGVRFYPVPFRREGTAWDKFCTDALFKFLTTEAALDNGVRLATGQDI